MTSYTVGLEPCPACPQGIVACAHLDGRVVWLADERLAVSRHQGNHNWTVLGPEITVPCSCPKDHVVVRAGGPKLLTNSLAEAEAEFARRDALLRAEP